MRRLKAIGPCRGTSGYDRHTRELVREFVRQGVEVELQHLEGWSANLPDHMRETWFDRLSAPVAADTVLHFTMPTHVIPDPDRRNINYTMFEADRIPQSWVEAAGRADRIVLTTEAARLAWEASGVPAERLRVSPLGVDGRSFSTPAEPLPLTAAGRPLASFGTRFLHMAELRARKNHMGLLEAWMQATRPDDDAVLILKASVFAPRALPAFEEDLAGLQQRLGRSLADAAPVAIVAESLTAGQIRSLYASATHYISMSRGEGWDLPMIEAGAAGLTLIAPRHTAYPTYLDEDAAHWIPAPAVPARFEGRLGAEDMIFFDGLGWWEPDVGAAAAIVRAIVDGTAPPRRSPQQRILDEFSWEEAARRLLDIVFEEAAAA